MPIYKRKNKSVFHIHVPKTGGSALVDACMQQRCTIDLFSKTPHPEHKITIQHFHYDLWKNLVPDIPKILTWREPWARTVSEYVWQKHTTDFSKIDKWLSVCLDIFNENPLWGDNHFMPQTKFFKDEKEIIFCQYDKTMSNIKNVFDTELDTDLKFITFPQKRRDYVLPNIDDVLLPQTKDKWIKLYQNDIDFFQNRL